MKTPSFQPASSLATVEVAEAAVAEGYARRRHPAGFGTTFEDADKFTEAAEKRLWEARENLHRNNEADMQEIAEARHPLLPQ